MTIGEIVEDLMRRHGLTLQAVAERVRAKGARNVKYQHIQQLLEFPTRRPRYLPELASAFGMSVEQFLAYRPDSQVMRLAEPEAAPYLASHSLGMDPQILASSMTLVRLACKGLEIDFDPESPDDAAIVLLGASYLAQRQERDVTPDNIVDFTMKLRERMKGSDEDKRSDSTGSVGPSAGKQSTARRAQ